jgi:hypothetical protein
MNNRITNDVLNYLSNLGDPNDFKNSKNKWPDKNYTDTDIDIILRTYGILDYLGHHNLLKYIKIDISEYNLKKDAIFKILDGPDKHSANYANYNVFRIMSGMSGLNF